MVITDWFIDDDGDRLFYTIESSNPGVVEVEIAPYLHLNGDIGTQVLVNRYTAGSVTITLSANDGKDGISIFRFTITD
ncbi:hypothetical protein [Lysinibacillus sp. 54212]|uniref:hypothetical protein n=1 Tax=Lysinibacillus sp. 54212 TaxID=3119829 RepID=UPI002FC964DB